MILFILGSLFGGSITVIMICLCVVAGQTDQEIDEKNDDLSERKRDFHE